MRPKQELDKKVMLSGNGSTTKSEGIKIEDLILFPMKLILHTHTNSNE
jgi:hypothetical protein